MTLSAFDFRSKLEKVQPKAAAELPPADEARRVDEIGERHAFTSREPVMRVERIRGAEPIDVLSVKGPLAVLNRFKIYCNETGQPYWRVLDEMLRQVGR